MRLDGHGDRDTRADSESAQTQAGEDGRTMTHRNGDEASPRDGGAVVPSIHNFRIHGRLGAGGMGVVYEAEQLSPRRRVALKVIRGGRLVDEWQIRLFQREANSLARLKHPGIATIYETGQTDEGQRFFAMELVAGLTLDRYLESEDRAARSPAEALRRRLRLFQQICDAVHYAHQRGVIHRDLKPTNIVVLGDESQEGSSSLRASEPKIKVLDFGLARITDPDAGDSTMTHSAGAIMGTLAYMSPEQAGGDPNQIDLRTDVYSLGVIIYEMLVGKRPYDTERSPLIDAIRVIRDVPPRPPREVLAKSRRLDPDLETICLKTLEKDADRRYPSAAALSEDIERFLTSQPILARPPSTVYQLKKLVKRKKGIFAFASTLLLLLIVFAATMSVMFDQQRRERIRADAERDKAEEINAFLQGMLASVDPQEKGRSVTVLEILDDASQRIETHLSEQPEVQAAIRSTIGVAYEALGNLEQAESQFRAALETRRQLFGEFHLDVAASMTDLAIYLRKTGDLEAAEPLYRRALEIRQALLEPDDPYLAESMHNLGSFLQVSGKLAGADTLMSQAQQVFRAAYGEEDPIVILSLLALAQVRQDRGAFAAAESSYVEAVRLARKVHGPTHPTLGQSLNGLGTLLVERNRPAEAEAYLREALEISRTAYGEEHFIVAKNMNNLGLALISNRAYAAAESLLSAALDLRRRTLGADHDDVAITLNNLGLLYDDLGDLRKAEEAFAAALEIRRSRLGPSHPGVALVMNNLAGNLHSQGRLVEAETHYRESLSMAKTCLSSEHPAVLNYQRELADLLRDRGDLAGAISLYEEVMVSIAESGRGPDGESGLASLGLGRTLLLAGRAAEAETHIHSAATILEQTLSVEDARTALAYCHLGSCLLGRGRYAEADSLLAFWSPAILADARISEHEKRGVKGDLERLRSWREIRRGS